MTFFCQKKRMRKVMRKVQMNKMGFLDSLEARDSV